MDEKALLGRTVQVEVAIKDSGWPTIANVLAARKARPGKTAARTPDPVYDISKHPTPEEA